jgi:membrane-bound lytic murein transglycosylase B
VTRASNVDEVIDKFIAQEHTHSTLADMTRDIQEKIKSLHTQRSEIRRKLEDTKYSGSGQLGSRRIVDEFQTHLDEAKAQLEKASQTYERVSKQYIAVEAGVEHLAEKLGLSRNVSDGTVATLLQQCGKELQARYGDTQRILEQGDSILYTVDMEPPQNNVRVKLLSEHEEEEEDRKGDGKEVEDAEDDPHDRAALKAMSESAVDRETKKAKKRNRKANEEA